MPLRPHRAAWWGLVAYVSSLALIVLWPVPVDRAASRLLIRALRKLHGWGLPEWVDYGFVESASNVLLFVPLGALVVWLLGRPYGWVGPAIGLLLSSLIELAQFLFLPERYPALADVAANTSGAVLGALFALLTTAHRKPVRSPPPASTL